MTGYDSSDRWKILYNCHGWGASNESQNVVSSVTSHGSSEWIVIEPPHSTCVEKLECGECWR